MAGLRPVYKGICTLSRLQQLDISLALTKLSFFSFSSFPQRSPSSIGTATSTSPLRLVTDCCRSLSTNTSLTRGSSNARVSRFVVPNSTISSFRWHDQIREFKKVAASVPIPKNMEQESSTNIADEKDQVEEGEAAETEDEVEEELTPAQLVRIQMLELIEKHIPGLQHVELNDRSGGCGSFFDLLVVAESFQGKPLVQQHRMVNKILNEHLQNIHGITVHTMTPKQFWALKEQQDVQDD